jgi:hypothetical protein
MYGMDGCSRSVGMTSWALRTPSLGMCIQGGGGNRSHTNRVVAQLLASERVPTVPVPSPDRFINVTNPIDTNKFTALTNSTRAGNPQVEGCFQTCRGLQALLTGVGVSDEFEKSASRYLVQSRVAPRPRRFPRSR